MLKAAQSGHINLATESLLNKADVNVVGNQLFTPLHHAVMSDSNLLVKILLIAGAKTNYRDHLWETPLHKAINTRNFELVQTLVTAKADINAKNSNQYSPIHLAIVNGDLDMLEKLWQMPNVNKDVTYIDPDLNRSELYLIHFACAKTNEKELINFLLKNDLKHVIHKPKSNSLLHIAANRGYVQMIKLLLNAGESIDSVNRDWQTPLCMAVVGGMIDAIRTLISAGADMYKESNMLFQASYHKNCFVVKLLLELGCDPIHINSQMLSFVLETKKENIEDNVFPTFVQFVSDLANEISSISKLPLPLLKIIIGYNFSVNKDDNELVNAVKI